ncbi:hypothetical protein [Gallaecimonas xiamenensis]|uniref:hypothetical protein n=1 Tax=Gallaecimonas xiamenensis TaxID=1207039 RepID=UPI0012E9F319|nr:hypothetical protein [Gallaecimonas xiamenensis]
MQHFLFASPSTTDRNVLNSISSLDEVCEGFFEVYLSGLVELKILFSLIGINNVTEEPLPRSDDFASVIDISQYKIPEFSTEDFEGFYEKWLQATGRESTMDEYGQLVFLQSQSKIWNSRPSKVVLSEKP